MASWVPVPTGSHFSIANIPFGIISTEDRPTPGPAVAIGEHALDLAQFAAGSGFSGLEKISSHLNVFSEPTLNAFAALGRPVHREVRGYLQDVLKSDTQFGHILKDNEALRQKSLIPLNKVQNHVPMTIGDYTDFFAGVNHASTMGKILRGPTNPLQPNYLHVPVAYHSRSSSIIISGSQFHRPSGQVLQDPTAEVKVPNFSPTNRLDIELELGVFLCRENKLGAPVPVNSASEGIFGAVIVNDWSARDVQAWEYVPLGPFIAKNFATTISAWVVLADALEPFLTSSLQRDRQMLPYLQEKRVENVWDIQLQVDLKPSDGPTSTITRTSAKNVVWSFAQMLAHHSVGGCNMRVGDLLASGTISGTEPGTQGSLVEQSKGGKEVIKLNGGLERKFLEDGDTIIITGWCGSDQDALVGFGDCSSLILPAVRAE
ncbi:hypothetical protein LTR10_020448 [Elasticomyces elasticus]|uniref:Fumarylacetoacetase n=1 Tax=Exophiala sideris TaxID=1016849 RepID=A0ABR0J412_9EURO|nr:hypothetical protein LTR10_020448 [Elasticomyces elasticus]KAK5027028.1 hypothetical protein LTS07_007327 [Exophiala sideris]KAK5034032.1 hypothetical protein LTR13_006632 [Exophiala sideris]KAK5055693.1 hypothetical protein LTR69_008068 [Exophiala sideris]KAK5180974.1 hypothetical protein LTR44_006794 [Eurotiomycetes sp. CCFEE 6388]